MMLKLKESYTYGPVQSRRLGSSLGINVLPSARKICTFNCLYCQYGWTDYKKMDSLGVNDFPTIDAVVAEVERKLSSLVEKPAYITFSGNGEPTLHPYFGKIVEEIIKIRNKISPSSKTAILSNSSTLDNEEVREAIRKLDVRIMKLDAGNEDKFSVYNQPKEGIRFDRIVAHLSRLQNVTIQTLLTGGKKGNNQDLELGKWMECLKTISPTFVQIYSLDRDFPSDSILKLERKDILKVKDMLDKAGIASQVY